MDTEKLKEFFEENGFIVNIHDDIGCAEVEMWTDGGVDMIINLQPFTKEEFIEYVEEYFNVDDEIDSHRQDQRYRNDFTITQSLKDFTKYHKYIKKVANKLKKLK
jgi:hypothetical protein